MNRLTFVLAAAACSLFAAKDPVSPVYSEKGVAIKGVDVVAYFTDSKMVMGKPEFKHQWNGAEWHFSSAEHRDLFAKEPARYVPQFGGYCAWAVSNNYTAPVDPGAWKIIDGKLYLNYNKDVQKKWEEGVLARIQAAEANWPGLHK
jgi:YHS domain-containing protein